METVHREVFPLSIGKVTEGHQYHSQMCLGVDQRFKRGRRSAHVRANASQRRGGDVRTDVVEHKPTNRGPRMRGENHSDDAAK
jgi:hypothetical protein